MNKILVLPCGGGYNDNEVNNYDDFNTWQICFACDGGFS